ncbi:MAG TPA: hypothetical protein VH396_19230 [Chitinophagaceae bacterium]|jgi:hypothetical protein
MNPVQEYQSLKSGRFLSELDMRLCSFLINHLQKKAAAELQPHKGSKVVTDIQQYIPEKHEKNIMLQSKP